MRKILITGGAGFIGYHLACRVAADADARVDLVDNLARGRLDEDLDALLRRPLVRLVRADLTQPGALAALDDDYDEVYHLAGALGVRNVIERSHEVLHTNVMSTLLVLEWFVKSRSRKVLFASTSEVYAWTGQCQPMPVPTPEDVPLALTDLTNPRSAYAGGKILGELATVRWCHAFAKSYVIVRYHNVYGPRMGYEHVIPELYRRAREGENPLRVFSASHTRAFCYIGDAVEATVASMRNDRADASTFNIGNDVEETSIGDLAHRVVQQAGLDVRLVPESADADPIARRCPDITRARAVLGYTPQVNLDEGLARTLAWYALQPDRSKGPVIESDMAAPARPTT